MNLPKYIKIKTFLTDLSDVYRILNTKIKRSYMKFVINPTNPRLDPVDIHINIPFNINIRILNE